MKTGGRVAGVPNKTPFDAYVAAHKHRCNPFEVMAMAANGDLPCNVCFGTGKTKYKTDGEIHERLCESCYGSLREHISPETRVKAASELAQYLASKRKQIDHTNSDGSLRPVWVVQVAPAPKPLKSPLNQRSATPASASLTGNQARIIDVPALAPSSNDDEVDLM